MISGTDSLGLIAAELMETGRDFHRRGWSLGTSSNYSAVLSRDPMRLLMTGSGFDKGRLTPDQFVQVDEQVKAVGETTLKPSAEAALHVALVRSDGAGAVLHTHSLWGTLLSEAWVKRGYVEIGGYEMLKGLAGITTHETTVRITIFPNTQDIATLAREVELRLKDPSRPLQHGFLMAGHGLYTWGKDVPEARRHIEVLEFLLEVVGRRDRQI
jgi:methylthioribulose-1-phosphate dehydratase